MLKLGKVRKHRAFIIVVVAVLVVFSGALGAVIYFGNQAYARQQNESNAKLAALDKQLVQIKAKKAAEKKAKEEADKAAAQKAAADAALAAQQAGQVVTPAGCAISGPHGNPNNIDVVVNKKHCFSPIDFVPGDLSSYNGYAMSAKVIPSLTAMFDAAAAAGLPLSITSAYRSYTNQVATYNNWVQVNGSTAAADTVSARPGYSEHQTGFAVDLSAGGCSLDCFLNSGQYTWMQEHAAEYGFIQRYPVGLTSITGYSDEAWHYRYVGTTVALDMKAKGIKTLEQYWGISGGGY